MLPVARAVRYPEPYVTRLATWVASGRGRNRTCHAVAMVLQTTWRTSAVPTQAITLVWPRQMLDRPPWLYARRDSNPQHLGPKPSVSASWTTSASAAPQRPGVSAGR